MVADQRYRRSTVSANPAAGSFIRCSARSISRSGATDWSPAHRRPQPPATGKSRAHHPPAAGQPAAAAGRGAGGRNRRLRDMRANTTGIAEKVLVSSILNVDLDPFRHRVLLEQGRGRWRVQGPGRARWRRHLRPGLEGRRGDGRSHPDQRRRTRDSRAVQPQRRAHDCRRHGRPGRLSLPFVTVESDVQPGDLLLSSGLGGVFPPGYPVAQVSKVKRAGSTFALVEAKPTAKLDQAREVLLVWFKERVEPVPAATGTEAATTSPRPRQLRLRPRRPRPPPKHRPQAQAGGE